LSNTTAAAAAADLDVKDHEKLDAGERQYFYQIKSNP